jgi:hypothetical protein
MAISCILFMVVLCWWFWFSLVFVDVLVVVLRSQARLQMKCKLGKTGTGYRDGGSKSKLIYMYNLAINMYFLAIPALPLK